VQGQVSRGNRECQRQQKGRGIESHALFIFLK
jgi:hypothetical protein